MLISPFIPTHKNIHVERLKLKKKKKRSFAVTELSNFKPNVFAKRGIIFRRDNY